MGRGRGVVEGAGKFSSLSSKSRLWALGKLSLLQTEKTCDQLKSTSQEK
jgi:hypothetical protein